MATKQTIDFSQTKDQSGFNPKRKEEGEYLGTITSFEDTKSKSGNAMWVFGVQLKTDRRATYPVYCLLGADQVWKLRNLMMAAGFAVPKKRITVDGNRLVGKDIGIFLADDEYEGKPKSVIESFFPASEYSGPSNEDDDSDEEEEYEEEAPEDEEYEDDEEPEDEVPADADEDDAEDETEEEPEDDEEQDEEPEDEPEPAPAKKKAPAARKAAPARATTKKRQPAPEPEDDEDEDEMDVDTL